MDLATAIPDGWSIALSFLNEQCPKLSIATKIAVPFRNIMIMKNIASMWLINEFYVDILYSTVKHECLCSNINLNMERNIKVFDGTVLLNYSKLHEVPQISDAAQNPSFIFGHAHIR